MPHLHEGADLVDDLGSGPGQAVAPQLVDLAADGPGPTPQGRPVIAEHDDLGGRVHQLVSVTSTLLARRADCLNNWPDVEAETKAALNSAAYRAARDGVRRLPVPPMMMGTVLDRLGESG